MANRLPNVTPFVGVWIETAIRGIYNWMQRVTPFVGVWIETVCYLSSFRAYRGSHPSWVCGLKLLLYGLLCLAAKSHPSWVCGLKHYQHQQRPSIDLSHPSWVCGLKRFFSMGAQVNRESHPSWVCGLKLKLFVPLRTVRYVTPFVGVWIETNTSCLFFASTFGHTLRGCVD